MLLNVDRFSKSWHTQNVVQQSVFEFLMITLSPILCRVCRWKQNEIGSSISPYNLDGLFL